MIEQKDYSKQYVASCFDPRIIRNRTTRQPILVGCGKCPACLNSKANSMASRLNAESRLHKWTFFVTLSYANEYIPRVRVDGEFGDPTIIFDPQVKLNNRGKFVKDYPDGESYDIFGDGPNDLGLTSDDYLASLSKTENDKYPFGYVEKKHLQKFIKRLRINAFRRYGATLRYYAVSEYGPKSLRPHYHALIFTDSKELAIDLLSFWNIQLAGDGKGLNIEDLPSESVLSASWKYGRVGCELVERSASSYVAGYISSTSSLPAVYRKCPRLRPFSLFSRCPAIGVPSPNATEIQKTIERARTGTIVKRNKKYVAEYPSVQTLCNYFPRTTGFNTQPKLCVNLRYRVYQLITEARKAGLNIYRYIDRLKEHLNYKTDDELLHDYYISRRAATYANLCGVTLDHYITYYIRRAWSNHELAVLADKYAYQESEFTYLSPVERINCNKSLVAAIGRTDMHPNMFNLIASYGLNPNSLPNLTLDDMPRYKAYKSVQTDQYLNRDKSKKTNSILYPEIL